MELSKKGRWAIGDQAIMKQPDICARGLEHQNKTRRSRQRSGPMRKGYMPHHAVAPGTYKGGEVKSWTVQMRIEEQARIEGEIMVKNTWSECCSSRRE